MSRISLVKLVVTIISVISSKKVVIFGGSLRLGGRYFGNFTVYTIHVQANVSECYPLDYVSLFVLVISQYSV